jgi:hypothetical protein
VRFKTTLVVLALAGAAPATAGAATVRLDLRPGQQRASLGGVLLKAAGGAPQPGALPKLQHALGAWSSCRAQAAGAEAAWQRKGVFADAQVAAGGGGACSADAYVSSFGTIGAAASTLRFETNLGTLRAGARLRDLPKRLRTAAKKSGAAGSYTLARRENVCHTGRTLTTPFLTAKVINGRIASLQVFLGEPATRC